MDRYELALLLASSLLQLHATSWWSDHLSAKDIRFLDLGSSVPLRYRAFVTGKFSSGQILAQPSSKQLGPRNLVTKDEAVFALGAMLSAQ